MTEYVNQYGRQGGRGIRPWLLLPKVIAVGLLLGGLAAAVVVTRTAIRMDNPAVMLPAIRAIFQWVVIPAGFVIVLTGVGLLMQHPRELLGRRWLQVKLVLIALGVPLAHFASRAVLMTAVRDQADIEAVRRNLETFATLLSVAVLGVIVISVIGRLKPRLGQPIKPRTQAA